MPEPERRLSNAELAAVWRTRLEKAKAEYDVAVATFRRSAQECRFRESPSADSDFSLRHAIRAENHARQRYVTHPEVVYRPDHQRQGSTRRLSHRQPMYPAAGIAVAIQNAVACWCVSNSRPNTGITIATARLHDPAPVPAIKPA